MKHKLTILFVLIVQFTFSQNPVLNAGFENWTNGEPDYWTTNNVPGFVTPISQVSPGNSGVSALKGVNAFVPPGLPFPPYITSTDINANPIPVSQAYTNLSFFYKLNLNGTAEFLNGAVAITDANSSGIGGGSATLYENSATNIFTQLNIPINYIGINPAGAIITFLMSDTIGGTGLAAGSYFIVDDVSLNFSTGLTEEMKSGGLGIPYPIPALDFINIPFTISQREKIKIDLFDLSGRLVLNVINETFDPGTYKSQVDVNELASGTYVCQLRGEKTISSVNIMISANK